MFRMSETVTIDRPAADVFDFVADLRNFPRWRANLAFSTVVSESSAGVGARCEEAIRIGPGRIPATCAITALSPGRRLSFRAVSPGVVYDGLMIVEPRARASSLTLSGEVHVSGLLRLIEPLLRRRMRGGVRSEVKAVKSDLEATDPDRRTQRHRRRRPRVPSRQRRATVGAERQALGRAPPRRGGRESASR